ncbi:hypothetical protein NP493_828g02043 [Ridgeia piscesae]|uniref:TMEM87A/B GOLD domain-containing protein n=1 Tax=Ridgeia piscesae TaxID=27915 RepID=A0AAD9KMJ7_RIDPI|nr:hypothetical protein NP493_828g02043 [Ridgeia piscesae]
MTLLHLLFGLVVVLPLTAGFPAQGHWEFAMHQKHNGTAVKKSMYKHSVIKVAIHCQANEDEDLNVKWKLFYLQCSNIAFEPEPGIVSIYMSLSLHICKK